MQPKRTATWVWFALSFAFALAAAWLARAALLQATAAAKVVVATRYVAPMSRIPADALAVQERGRRGLPDDALTRVADAAGQFTRTGLVPGQVVQRGALLAHAPGGTAYDAAVTEAAKAANDLGLRAVPLALDQSRGYTLVQPGDRVDVLAHVKLTGGGVAGVLAQGVLVLAKADEAGSGAAVGLPGAQAPSQATKGVVVLAADPPTAERIVLAAEEGRVYLALEPAGAPAAPLPQPVEAGGVFAAPQAAAR